MATKNGAKSQYPKLHYTRRGAIYAHPKDIISSRSAQRQIKELRDSKLVRTIKSRKKKENSTNS